MANSKRKCGGCGEYFRPVQVFPGPVAWCSPDCGVTVAKKRRIVTERAQEAAQRKLTSQARERIKPMSKWRAEAQAAVNRYVRLRDKGLPCVSCDRPDDGKHQRHASHYRSVKACSALRYNPDNIYASCAQCNASLSGNLIEYRIRLVRRFGLGLVDWLEAQNGVTRYTVEDLKKIISDYRGCLN